MINFTKCLVVVMTLVLVSMLYAFSGRLSGQLTPRQSDNAQVEADLQTIRKLIREKKLVKLNDFQTTITNHWKASPEIRDFLLSDLCKALNSGEFGDARSSLYARNCAKNVLKVNAVASIDIGYDMLKILQEVEEYRLGVVQGTETWSNDRKERVALLIQYSNRVESAYDPAFDIKDVKNRPIGNVCPPAPNYTCGIRTEDIKDLAVRDAYIAAIEKNNNKAQRFNLQIKVQRIMPTLAGFIDRFLVGMYSQPPADKVHLSQALNQLKIFGNRRTAIVNSVEAAISSK
jgi:hypothetical protein